MYSAKAFLLRKVVLLVLVALDCASFALGGETNQSKGATSNAVQNAMANWDQHLNEQARELQKRAAALRKIFNSHPTDWDAFEKGARAKLSDFPELSSRDLSGSPYADFEILILHHYSSRDGNPAKARALAEEIVASSAPEHYRLRADGFVRRLDSVGKPVAIQFTAMDGRHVDTSAMRGKVVLVDFWAVHCPGCLLDMPGLKATYDKFHGQGLEIVGIDSDDDIKKVQRVLKKEGIPWPQYFQKPEARENELLVKFGIYSIPHLMLLDKAGVLRYDHVIAGSDLEEKISKLIAERDGRQ